MIEAVKSTVANSAHLRGSVEQTSTLNSFAANPDKLQIASQAPYVSPTVRVDVNTKIAILEFRESVSGEVLAQIPSEQAIRSYKLREAKQEAQLLAKLTQKSGTQKGPTPISTNTGTGQAQESAPAPTVSESSSAGTDVSANAEGVSLAAQLEAVTTQLTV